MNRGILKKHVNLIKKCDCCGKHYQSHTSDTNEPVCGLCWDSAGYFNAHSDGMHETGKEKNCPSCNKVECLHQLQTANPNGA